MISPTAVISLRDDIVRCTVISKLCLDCGIFESLCAILAAIYIISISGDCHACARNDNRVWYCDFGAVAEKRKIGAR